MWEDETRNPPTHPPRRPHPALRSAQEARGRGRGAAGFPWWRHNHGRCFPILRSMSSISMYDLRPALEAVITRSQHNNVCICVHTLLQRCVVCKLLIFVSSSIRVSGPMFLKEATRNKPLNYSCFGFVEYWPNKSHQFDWYYSFHASIPTDDIHNQTKQAMKQKVNE